MDIPLLQVLRFPWTYVQVVYVVYGSEDFLTFLGLGLGSRDGETISGSRGPLPWLRFEI